MGGIASAKTAISEDKSIHIKQYLNECDNCIRKSKCDCKNKFLMAFLLSVISGCPSSQIKTTKNKHGSSYQEAESS